MQRRRTIHDPAARRQGAVCKPPFIPINLLLTITAQHCLITESRHGPRSEGAIDCSSWGRAEARGAPRSNRHVVTWRTTPRKSAFRIRPGDFRRTWLGCPDCGCDHLDLFLIGMPLVYDGARLRGAWRSAIHEDRRCSFALFPCYRSTAGVAGLARHELMGRKLIGQRRDRDYLNDEVGMRKGSNPDDLRRGGEAAQRRGGISLMP